MDIEIKAENKSIGETDELQKLTNDTNCECPVCMEFMLPPIYQCYNGHPICNTCEGQIELCPVCRDEFPKQRKIRSLVLEGIVVGLTFDCKNYDQGCQATLKYDEIEAHSWECQFMTHGICSLIGFKCEAKKSSQTILNHLKSMHSVIGINMDDLMSDSDTEESHFGSSPIEVCQSVSVTRVEKGGKPKWAPVYFIYHGQILFLTTTFDPAEKSLSWTVSVLASAKVAKEFLTRIKLMPKNSGVKYLECQDQVFPLQNGNFKSVESETKTKTKTKDKSTMNFNISLENLTQLCNSQKSTANDSITKDKVTFASIQNGNEEKMINWRLQLRFAQMKENDTNFHWKEELAGVVMDSALSYEFQGLSPPTPNVSAQLPSPNGNAVQNQNQNQAPKSILKTPKFSHSPVLMTFGAGSQAFTMLNSPTSSSQGSSSSTSARGQREPSQGSANAPSTPNQVRRQIRQGVRTRREI